MASVAPLRSDACSPRAAAVAQEPWFKRRCGNYCKTLVPGLSNFSVQYNLTAASIGVDILNKVEMEPAWSKDLTLPIVFLGAMLGMAFMGRLGDVIGRTKALTATLAMTVLGALLPAGAPSNQGGAEVAYGVVCVGRLILGIGVGGIYPLSAVSSAEACDDSASRGLHVGRAFMWQSVGACAPYAVAMLLAAGIWSIPDEVQFRIVFMLGAVPAAIVLLLAVATGEDSEEFRNRRETASSRLGSRRSTWQVFALQPRSIWTTLAGTAGSWFFYDIAYYGTGIFTPDILHAICLTGERVGDQCVQTVYQTASESFIVAIMGIPGVVFAVCSVRRIGSKRLNTIGFFLIAAAFGAFALAWKVNSNQHELLFGLFCLITFLLNWGPNVGTYVLPALCFPCAIRSTSHGLSACGGKLGALCGALLFAPISSAYGVECVFCIQVVACILGGVFSQIFLRHEWEYLEEDERLATISFVDGPGSFNGAA